MVRYHSGANSAVAEATEDRQWIHVDSERAQRDSPYRTTIAHGFLTLALLSHFLRQAIQIGSGVRMSVNYGLNRVRFPSPVLAGSRIRAHFTLQALKDVAAGVDATFSVVIDVENSEKALLRGGVGDPLLLLVWWG
jgi:acyl dehydratase